MISPTRSEIQVSARSHLPSEFAGARDFKPARTLYDGGAEGPLEHALEATRRGFHVFPVAPDGKRPLIKAWEQQATLDPEQIKAWFEIWPDANVGIACGPSGLFVVDVDVKKGKRGTDTLADLELDESCPLTFEVETPSGGRHLYYRGAGANSSETNLGPGIDTRGQGGYVVGPGSRINGKSYTIREDREIIDAPPKLIARCASTIERSGGQRDEVDLDKPGNIKRAADFLKRTAPAIEGHGGDNHTYKTACVVRDFGISEDMCVKLMAKHFNPRCEPPWPHDELQTVIHNAYNYAKRNPGERTAEHAFKDVERPPTPANDDEPGGIDQAAKPDGEKISAGSVGLPLVSFVELYEAEPQPVAEIVPGLIEKGIPTFLSGPGGTNKSRLALQLGLCISAGKMVFGRQPEQATFVYFASEDGRDEVTRRVHMLAKRLDISKEQAKHAEYHDCTARESYVAVMSEDGTYELAPFYHQLLATLRKIPGHKFVALDSCYDFVTFKGNAKINEGAVNAFVKQILGKLCRAADATLIVLWHPSQAGHERGDASGWSVAWHNAPRAKLSIRKNTDCDDSYILKVEKRNHGRDGDEITLHWSDGALLPREGLENYEQAEKLHKACVDLALKYAEKGKPLVKQGRVLKHQLDEIAEVAGTRPTSQQVKNELSKALGRGRLVYARSTRHKAAGYYPAEGGDELAKEAKRQSKVEKAKRWRGIARQQGRTCA